MLVTKGGTWLPPLGCSGFPGQQLVPCRVTENRLPSTLTAHLCQHHTFFGMTYVFGFSRAICRQVIIIKWQVDPNVSSTIRNSPFPEELRWMCQRWFPDHSRRYWCHLELHACHLVCSHLLGSPLSPGSHRHGEDDVARLAGFWETRLQRRNIQGLSGPWAAFLCGLPVEHHLPCLQDVIDQCM